MNKLRVELQGKLYVSGANEIIARLIGEIKGRSREAIGGKRSPKRFGVNQKLLKKEDQRNKGLGQDGEKNHLSTMSNGNKWVDWEQGGEATRMSNSHQSMNKILEGLRRAMTG